MSEDTLPEPVAPATSVDQPTVEAPATETMPVTGPPPMEPPPPGAGAPTPSARSGVFVPKWLILGVGGFLLLVIGFAAGHAVGSDRNHHEPRAGFSFNMNGRRPFGGNTAPFGPTPRNGNGRNGGGQNATPSSTVYLGVAVQDSSNPAGAELARVLASSPAADAGLQSGDVVTAMDSTSIKSAADLTTSVRSHQAGDQVSVTYSRGGASKTVNVQLATRPAVPDAPQLPPQ